MLSYVFAIMLCVCAVHGGSGTTQNIETIFLGRCFEYQELPKGRLTNITRVNCTQLWLLFKSSWAFKDPQRITHNDYAAFLTVAKIQTFPENKTLLWSGTYDIAHEYSNRGRRYITLEDSLIGYLVDGLTWCGKVCLNCDGINYETCPDWTTLPQEASEAFWGGLSETFAHAASGEVRLVVAGSNPQRPAYTRHSIFARYELLALPQSTKVTVILVNSVDRTPIEHCDTGSLLDLKHDVDAQGLGYVCIENPDDIMHLVCVDNVSSHQCALQHKQPTNLQPIG